MTRPTGVPRQQISVQELLRRVRAENAAPQADRAGQRVQAAIAVDEERRRAEVLMRWLVAAAGVVTVLSGFALISFVVHEDPGGGSSSFSPELPPATSNAVSFTAATATETETETVTLSATKRETATVTQAPETDPLPYGSP
jgi:hypothetical protein